jgi:hypothetical protein
MLTGLLSAVLAGFILVAPAAAAFASELKTQYTIVTYDKEEQLRKFNKGVSFGSLSYLLRNRMSITSDDEVRNKVDVLVERVEAILDMFPRDLKFRIVLLSTDTEVQRVYKNKYGAAVDYISFYSPRDKTVFISADDVRIGVLAHELAHVILDFYFGVSPPVKIHEVLAQFVETHLKD